MKNKRLIITLIFIFLFIITTVIYLVIINHKNDLMFKNREHVVTLIKSNELEIKSNGIVILPQELHHISDSGECKIIEFKGQTAIYFYSYRGLLESSKGYIFVTEEIDYKNYIDVEKYHPSLDFAKLEQIDDNWFFCSTN